MGRRIDIPVTFIANADRAKLNSRRRYIGFEPNSSLAFVNVPDIIRNVDYSKRSEIIYREIATIKLKSVWDQ